METQKPMEERLWDFIDGRSAASEKSFIEKILETDIEWKAKYHELLEAHRLFQTTELEEPSMRFTKNVMEEIAKFHNYYWPYEIATTQKQVNSYARYFE